MRRGRKIRTIDENTTHEKQSYNTLKEYSKKHRHREGDKSRHRYKARKSKEKEKGRKTKGATKKPNNRLYSFEYYANISPRSINMDLNITNIGSQYSLKTPTWT